MTLEPNAASDGPSPPGSPGSRRKRRRRWLAFVGALALLWVAQEVVPWMPQLNSYRSTATYQLSYDDDVLAKTKFGEDCPPVVAPEAPKPTPELAAMGTARYIECSVSCAPAGRFCEALERSLGCDAAKAPRRSPGSVRKFDLRVTHDGEPFCYLPLYRAGRITYEVTFNSVSDAATGDVQLCQPQRGYVEQRMVGLASCRQFRELLGVNAARSIQQEIEQEAERRDRRQR